MAPKLAFGFKKSKKPKVAVQLEEEEEEETPVPKKQKTEESTGGVREPPEAPEDPEVLKVANKLAEYVAKNGRSFEDVAKTRNTEPESPFREQEHYRGYGQRGDHQQEGYHRHDDPRGQSNYDSYYGEHYRSTDTGSRDGGLEAKSEEQYGRDNYQEDHEKTNYDGRDRDRRDQHYGYQGYGGNQVYRERTSGYGGRERSFSESGGRERSFSEKPERRPAASSTPREKSPGRLAAEAAAADGDSMALMNYFTKKAAQQEDARAAKKDPKEMPPLRDELPEKDKNKHVRPAKAPDGKSRTHHMGHYIPEEEMTKFMAKCGSEADKAKAADIDASKRIDSSNKGYALLAKMGWSE
eukprot:gene18250-21755_t